MANKIARTGLVYSKRFDSDMKSYREIAEEMGDISYVMVGNIINGAFYKVAQTVIEEMTGERPERKQVVNLSRDPDFQELVVEELRKKIK